MADIKNIKAGEWEETVLKSPIPVLVDFWATWCGPCLMMAPVLEQLAKDYDGKLSVVKVDVDQPENQLLAGQYNIQSIPNMKIFKGGQVIEELIGFRPAETLRLELASVI